METITQYTVRSLIVLSTAYIALKAPYFGSMVGTVGGLTDALQCFVLPPLIYMEVEMKNTSMMTKMYYITVVVIGIGTILYTSVSTLSQAFA
jgi:hypothetical protein